MSFLSPGANLHRGFNLYFGDQGASVCTGGPTWTQRAQIQGTMRTVLWTGSLFFAAGGDAPGTGPLVQSSPDGITWTATGATPGVTNAIPRRLMAYAAGFLIVIARSDNYSISANNGAAWSTNASITNANKGLILAGLGKFVVFPAGLATQCFTAPLGLTPVFANSTAYANDTFNVGAVGPDRFMVVATTASRAVMTSPDGLVWTVVGTLPAGFNSANSLLYGAGRWLVINGTASVPNQCAVSTDNGATWTVSTLAAPPATQAWQNGTYAQGVFMIVSASIAGFPPSIATSPDGLVFTVSTKFLPTDAQSTVWYVIDNGAGHYAAVTQAGVATTLAASGIC